MMGSVSEELARKKVKALKHWYMFMVFAVFGTVFLLWLGEYLINVGSPWFVRWLVMIGPVIWWIIIIYRGLHLHGYLPKLLKNWEERQIKKFLEEDDKQLQKYK